MTRFLPLAVAIAVLMLNIAYVGYISGLKESYNIQYQARGLVILTEQLISHLKDIETGVRGYIITENKDFLQPYNKGVVEVSINIDNLSKYDDIDLTKIDRVRKETREFLDYNLKMVELVKQGKAEEAADFKNASEGKLKMDSLRIVIGNLQQSREEIQMRQREKVLEGLAISDYLLYINAATAFFLVGLFLWRMVSIENDR